MVKSMYAAIAGLRTHQSKMDVISNNIANVNTWGYKTRSANFQDAMYQNMVNSTGGNVANGGSGGVNASQIGYGVNMGSITTNFATGSWGYTGRSLDCMINGTGFFIVGPMKEGEISADDISKSGLSLSKVGIFSVDNNGYLVDASGNYVYGFAPNAGEDAEGFDTSKLVPIKAPVPDGEEGGSVIASYTIKADGSITCVTEDSETITIGQLAVASVTNPNGLSQSSGYLYDIGENAGAVSGIATTGATGEILSNYLEMSNVDLSTDMANMITTQRGYQANTKIITVTDEMLEQLVNMKR
ncbi:flagellar hook protein FlgE [Lachnospiraceae bacterium PF1-21]|uniref:Flagellar hook-basal body complex protein n=1 Tax=Ohessyouella blattaphilus TaxID=2949333 RepID=A0ABT1EEQ3_9FIRM|nr:flagellar hook-basal body complex protein [Ohessyouella blattaphilus]MCP1109123.1 flagellar hook-basal body complex protein [Ohessyouella blattaphilus]MCR8562517.1 flagellar hook-basal body complex protein [Ohessyouella blattaphilus]